jgi:hypothetical protein
MTVEWKRFLCMDRLWFDPEGRFSDAPRAGRRSLRR